MSEDATDPRSVHIHADRAAIVHKLSPNLSADEVAYWTVSGTPQQTGPGATIQFADGGERVLARGDIVAVEAGRIYFENLTEPDGVVVPGIRPPTRGFKYGPATAAESNTSMEGYD